MKFRVYLKTSRKIAQCWISCFSDFCGMALISSLSSQEWIRKERVNDQGDSPVDSNKEGRDIPTSSSQTIGSSSGRSGNGDAVTEDISLEEINAIAVNEN